MENESSEFYARQAVLPGVGLEGLARLRARTIAVAGVGGVAARPRTISPDLAWEGSDSSTRISSSLQTFKGSMAHLGRICFIPRQMCSPGDSQTLAAG